MSEKLFSVVGESTLNGKTSIRVANDIKRRTVLQRNGHTNILLVVLPQPMSKTDAIAFWNKAAVATSTALRDAKGRFVKQAFQFIAA